MIGDGINKATDDVQAAQTPKPLCPFLNKPCIGRACAVAARMMVNRAGSVKTMVVCSLPALVQILSEVNQKTVMPQQQRLQMPQMFRGPRG